MNKAALIEKIEIKYHRAINTLFIDCSRYQDSYGTYTDARSWFREFTENKLTLHEYLEGISEDTLKQMLAFQK